MKIVFFGTPSFVVPVLEALTKHHDAIAVVTAPDKKVGRKQLLTASPVKQFAVKHNIPVLEIVSGAVDLFVVAAYGKIIPQSILEIPKHGAVNIHPSSLPKYRGPSPITQTILNGDKESAITFMQMDEKMDHGPILKTLPYEIPEDATTETLTHDMFAKAAELLPEVIDDYVAGKIKPTPQKDEDATYTHIITKQDGYIDLDSPLDRTQLDRKIRAYYPWPTVWARLPLVIARPRSGEAISSEKIIKFLPEKKIQMEGGKPMSVKDFLNGYPELEETIKRIFEI